MRAKYPGVDAAYTNSGGLRAGPRLSRRRARASSRARSRGARCSPCCRSATARRSSRSPAPSCETAFVNGFTPVCDPAFAGGTGRFPQISGLKVHVPLQRHDAGRRPACGRRPNGVRRHARRRSGRPTPSASSRTTSCTRAATATRSSRSGTNVPQPGDDLLQVDDRLHHGALAGRPRSSTGGSSARSRVTNPQPASNEPAQAGRLVHVPRPCAIGSAGDPGPPGEPSPNCPIGRAST